MAKTKYGADVPNAEYDEETGDVTITFKFPELPADTPPEIVQRAKRLHRWLINFMAHDVAATVVKAVDYGGSDFDLMGEGLMLMLDPKLRDKIHTAEAAVAFYMLGKIARIASGYEKGGAPNDDSFFDTHVYSLIALKIREDGYWI
jgi:hypothetical protein